MDFLIGENMAKYINPETDGQFYTANDMVRANCMDCKGCHACCEAMGDSIVLDPYDLYQLNVLGHDFQSLLQNGKIALHVEDYMILPHMNMDNTSNCCGFLDDRGRCSIHANRPGICRLFPLGRDFQEGELSYILLKDACKNDSRSKVKVDKWIGVNGFKQYETFVKGWHDFRREMGVLLAEASEQEVQTMSQYLLQLFYMTPYTDNFYPEIQLRMEKIRNLFV